MSDQTTKGVGEFERISANLFELATQVQKASTLTPLGLASIFAGIGAALILNDLGRETAVKFLRDYATSLEQGHDDLITRPN